VFGFRFSRCFVGGFELGGALAIDLTLFLLVDRLAGDVIAGASRR
jgi:hypothetical protein